MDRLFNDPTRKLLNFHIAPGDKPVTAEQICGEVNKAMDEVERRKAAGDFGDGAVKTGRPQVNVRDLVDGL
jgi:hypothetical protein